MSGDSAQPSSSPPLIDGDEVFDRSRIPAEEPSCGRLENAVAGELREGEAGWKSAHQPRFLISDLIVYLECYLSEEQVTEVYRAYLFSAEAHEPQRRRSGEPYIYHPVAVTRILAEMRMDYKCLMAALLHDVLEDTPVTKAELQSEFDAEIADLVDGVTKLAQIDPEKRAEAQSASFQKMVLAMARDIRVILIKLADRLHNMRTLAFMPPEKRRRISRETHDIYAPIAYRLGIYCMHVELDELGFEQHWPWRYGVLKRAVDRVQGLHQELLHNVETAIRDRLHQEDIEGDVKGRRKHLYGIYRKMRDKRRSFSEIVDVFALRIVVKRVDDCYRVLGHVHSLYSPVPGRFKDYVAIPKSNGYQSLHTILLGPQGVPIEIQIRTEAMDRMASAGIAGHWLYKTGHESGGRPQGLATEWLQNLLEIQKGSGSSEEFLEQVRVDLFPDEVYVCTPKGQILVLPRDSTVVDFAYAIHTDVGHACVGARIDRRLSPLRAKLRSGVTVEIITAPGARPQPSWLNFVATIKARANIRNYLKGLQHSEAESLGRRMLNAELARLGTDFDHLDEPLIAALLAEYGLNTMPCLFAEIGLGNRIPTLVARRLVGETGREDVPCEPGDDAAAPKLAIRGTEGMVVTFARCCRPIRGDVIVGMFSPGKGVVVHRQECRNLGELQRQPDKWVDVEWTRDGEAELPTWLRVEVGNRRGALATVASAIAEMGSNIENVQSREKDGMTSALDFLVNVSDRRQLARVVRRLRRIPIVLRILRLGT